MAKGYPTQERLQELFDYREDGELIRKCSAGASNIGDIAGYVNKETEYGRISVDNKLCVSHRLIFIYKYGYDPENDIDHIDRIKSNNKLENLREVTRSCNARNSGNRKDNISGVKGVYWNKNSNKWHVRVKVMGKQKHLGYYDDFNEAALNRLAAEQCLEWEGCDSSSPAYKYCLKNKLIKTTCKE